MLVSKIKILGQKNNSCYGLNDALSDIENID